MAEFIRLAEQDKDDAAIARELRRFWPESQQPFAFDPINDIAHAVAVAERIAELIDAHGNTGLNYLLLEQVSRSGNDYTGADGCRWAATFLTAAMRDMEWYEQRVIHQYHASARGRTPAAAIARAAVQLVDELIYLAEAIRD